MAILLLIIGVAGLLISTYLLGTHWLVRRRQRRNACSVCSYPRDGCLGLRCPECGRVSNPTNPLGIRFYVILVAILFFMLPIAAGVLLMTPPQRWARLVSPSLLIHSFPYARYMTASDYQAVVAILGKPLTPSQEMGLHSKIKKCVLSDDAALKHIALQIVARKPSLLGSVRYTVHDLASYDTSPTRIYAIHALGTDGAIDEDVAILINVLCSDSEPITDRLTAGVAMAGVPKGLIDAYQDELLHLLFDDDDRIVASVLVALRSGRQLNIAVEHRVVEIARNSPNELRVNALLALGHTPIASQIAIQAILPAIGDTDDAVKMAAIWSIGTYGKEARVAIPILRKVADDPDETWLVRTEAIDTIRKIE